MDVLCCIILLVLLIIDSKSCGVLDDGLEDMADWIGWWVEACENEVYLSINHFVVCPVAYYLPLGDMYTFPFSLALGSRYASWLLEVALPAGPEPPAHNGSYRNG
jgi:hypothetical protein